jgi:hypothetical protein
LLAGNGLIKEREMTLTDLLRGENPLSGDKGSGTGENGFYLKENGAGQSRFFLHKN